MMDVPDIVAAFQFNNTVINSQAFTSLIQLLSKSPNDNAAKNCLYKSFYEFGDEISNWSMKAVPTLLKNDVIKSGNLVEECISRLGANDTFNHRLISIIVSLKLDDELRVLLSMTKKGDNVVKLLLKNAQNIDISRQIPYFKALILCQDVQGSTRDVVFQLLKRICETKPELSWFLKRTDNSYNSNSSELDWSDPFNISEKLHLEPELLISEKFPSSYTLFPTILSLFKAWSDLNKVCPEMLTTTILNNAKNLLAKSMVVSLKDYGDTGSKRVFNSYNMLQLIVAEGANGYVNCWMKFLETRNQLPFGEEAMLFAASLIPFGEASSVFFILDEIVKASPFLANTMLNFYMMLYTKPHCQVDSLTILKSIKHLVCSKLIHQSDTANVLIKLGVQEKCRMLIYKLSNPKLSLSQNGEDFFMSYITDLSFVTSCLSQERVDHLLENLLNFGVRNASKKREILEAISGCLDIMTVDNYIEKLLPTFECFDNESVFVNLVSQLNFGSEFEGRVNLTFDFFIESRKGVDINLSQLLLLFEAANQSDICLRIFGYNMFINDLSTIIHVMMNLVSVHNLHTSNGSYKVDTFLFFLVLVCAFPVQLPFPWVGKENTKEILLKRWSYFWDKGFLPSLPSKSTAVMQRFLLSHLSNYDDGKVTPIIREMLISLFGRSETTIDDVLKMDNKERHLLFLCESS